MKYNAFSTKKHLSDYIGQELEKNGLDAGYVAYAMENTFKQDIHTKIEGFINFMKNEIKENPEKEAELILDIKITLMHDAVGGIKNDKLMIPRVSEYSEYAEV